MTTTLNLPDKLFHEIQERARATGSTVDVEAAGLLSKALAREAREAVLMKEIREERELLAQRGAFLTDEIIHEAKNWGRK